MTEDEAEFVLDIEWWDEESGLPDLVGPFMTEDEAQEWADLNVNNASYDIREVTYPYYRAER